MQVTAPVAETSQMRMPLSAQHTASRVASVESASATTAAVVPSSLAEITLPLLHCWGGTEHHHGCVLSERIRKRSAAYVLFVEFRME